MKSGFFRASVNRKFIALVVVFLSALLLSGIGMPLFDNLAWAISRALGGEVPDWSDVHAAWRWTWFLIGFPFALGNSFGWGIAGIIGGAGFRLRPLHCLALAAGSWVVLFGGTLLAQSALDRQLFKEGAVEVLLWLVCFLGPGLAAAAVSALLGCWIGNKLRARLSRVRESPQVA